MNKPIKYFVFLSLVSHLFLGLLWLIQPEKNIEWHSSDEMSILITQNISKNPTPKNIVKKEIKLPKKESQEEAVTQNLVTKEKNTHLKDSMAHSKIIAQLKNRLSTNFYYPKLAQKRNWEGQVTIGFLLHTSGQLSEIVIIKSSGYKILDNAAIKAIANIKNSTEIIVNHDINIKLPIIYRLSKG